MPLEYYVLAAFILPSFTGVGVFSCLVNGFDSALLGDRDRSLGGNWLMVDAGKMQTAT